LVAACCTTTHGGELEPEAVAHVAQDGGGVDGIACVDRDA
jgi:hypothetical protein